MNYKIKSVGIRHLDWVGLILNTELPSASKMLSLYLARFMNKDQDMAWPSLARIEKETSLGKATVCRHLTLLEAEGWLKRVKGNPTTNTRYYIAFPQIIHQITHKINKSLQLDQLSTGDSWDLLPPADHSMNLENIQGSSPNEPGSLTVELPSLTMRQQVVSQRDTNSQLNKQTNNIYVQDQKSNNENLNRFIEFWNNYPRKENKKKTKTTFLRLSKTKQLKAIEDCKTRYQGIEKQYIPLPSTYLNGERFNDDPLAINSSSSDYGIEFEQII